MNNKKVRIQKWMAQCGIASRRACEHLIALGKVKVNGRPVKLGDKMVPQKDVLSIDGKRIHVSDQNKKYYIMLNKPRGYVTTMKDEKNRKCVADLVKNIPARLYPIGRLDKDSEGLLLMTNDGDFANNVAHPSKHLQKTYRVTVRSNVTDEQVIKMSNGIEIDGKKTLPCNITVLSRSEGRSVMEIGITQGRNRQIRKMCESVCLEVIRLKRIKIGQIKLGMLKIGDWRDLTEREIKMLSVH